MDFHEEKKSFRKSALELRGGLAPQEVCIKSGIIMKKLMGLKQFAYSKTVMSYMDFRNEVSTDELLKYCAGAGKRIVLPLVVNQEKNIREIVPCEITDVGKELEIGAYGILEPKKDLVKVIPPHEIDLVVVPGVAFDEKRFRMGYGAGYYDRFLRKTGKNCLRAGVAFDLQVFGSIPVEPHDIKLDMIITESRIF